MRATACALLLSRALWRLSVCRRGNGRVGWRRIRLITICSRLFIRRNAAFTRPSTDFARLRAALVFVVPIFLRDFARPPLESFLVPPFMGFGFGVFDLRAVCATRFLARSIACLPERAARGVVCDGLVFVVDFLADDLKAAFLVLRAERFAARRVLHLIGSKGSSTARSSP